MKVYPDKKTETKVSRYHQNLKEIAKISNYQPIPSIPALSDDFNFTFLAKDYDQANPYLNKNSMRGSLQKKSENQHQSFLYEEDLFDMPFANKGSQILLKKENNKQKFKLPNIKNPTLNLNQKSSSSIQSMKKNKQQRRKSQQKQLNRQNNKSVTIATRLETDDVSILEDPSMSSLLKVETKSLCRSIEAEPFSRLKESKISNPEIEMLRKHKQFLERHNLQSRNLSELSRFDQLSPSKSIETVTIQEEQSTGSETQDEFIKDSVPGPGAYSISHHTSFSKPSLGSSTISKSRNFTFGSRETRFKPEKRQSEEDKSLIEKLQYLKQKQAEREERIRRFHKRERKVVPFNCKEQTKLVARQNLSQSIISPVYYNPRNGIEEELIKKIQRNFKGGFGFGEKRFRTVYKKNSLLGPGSYSVGVSNPQDDECKKMAYYFMSKKNRFQ